jgi:hypothetical protein
MSNYLRSTRECAVAQLRPELRRAIEEYFQENVPDEAETEAVLCCETVSEKKEPGWLESLLGEQVESPIYLATLLTATHLIWVRSGPQTGTSLTTANLAFIRVKAYSGLLIQDTGLEIAGLIGDSKSKIMRGHLGLGPEPAAQKFLEATQAAIAKINPESTRKWPSWMGR